MRAATAACSGVQGAANPTGRPCRQNLMTPAGPSAQACKQCLPNVPCCPPSVHRHSPASTCTLLTFALANFAPNKPMPLAPKRPVPPCTALPSAPRCHACCGCCPTPVATPALPVGCPPLCYAPSVVFVTQTCPSVAMPCHYVLPAALILPCPLN